MENLKKTLPSGSVLEVTMSSFEEGDALRKAVTKEIETLNISTGSIDLNNFSLSLDLNDDIINTIKNYASRISSSEDVEFCLWKCMGRATIDNIKITRSTFEDAEKRRDYIIVMKEVLFYNLAPFFQDLGSLLSDMKTDSSSIQK